MPSSFFVFVLVCQAAITAESPRCQMLDQAFPCESHLMPDFCGPSQVCWMCVRASVLQRHSLQAWVDGCICLCNWMCVCVCVCVCVRACSCLRWNSVKWKMFFSFCRLNLPNMLPLTFLFPPDKRSLSAPVTSCQQKAVSQFWFTFKWSSCVR